MIKTPLVQLKRSIKTQILFWILMFICYFTLWFILFPSMLFYYLNNNRPTSMVLCSLDNHDWT